jgi:hypothetical protein
MSDNTNELICHEEAIHTPQTTPATVTANRVMDELKSKSSDDLDMEITSLRLKRNLEDYKLRRGMTEKKNIIEVNHQLMFFKNRYMEYLTQMFFPSNKHLKALLLKASDDGEVFLDIQVATYRTSSLLKQKKAYEMECVGKTEKPPRPPFMYLPFMEIIDNPFIEPTEEIKHNHVALLKAFTNIEEIKGTSVANQLIDFVINRVFINVQELWVPLGIKVSKQYDGVIRKSKICFRFKW